MTPALQQLNAATAAEATAQFLRCCGSRVWATAMAARRPFAAIAEVHSVADTEFERLLDADWYEAFSAHPRIGESTPRSGRETGAGTWSADEQAGAQAAGDRVRHELAVGNDAYYRRFGHVFLICATGKSADQMLVALNERLGNDAEEELAAAAREQSLITHLRLDKLLAS